jgi:hypothetical protein
MNHKEACINLDIKVDFETLTIEELKQKYRIKALLFHPDKNRSPDAVSNFQEIKESFDYLMKKKGFIEDDSDEYEMDEVDDFDLNEPDFFHNSNENKYSSLLFSFLKYILKNESNIYIFYIILKRITSCCEKNTLEFLRRLDIKNIAKIYEILKNYNNVLHLGDGLLDKIQEIILEKRKIDECIILNPTINDLFENNLYKINMNDTCYVIPLWHNELIYDNSGNDIYIKCFPILSENVEIDEKNNIHVSVEYNIRDIWEKNTLDICLGRYIFPIDVSLLKMRKEQIVMFIGRGISRINTENIYDISKKGDVYIHVSLEL